MAEKQSAEVDNYSIMVGLELSSRALADYFFLKQKGKSDEDIIKEFSSYQEEVGYEAIEIQFSIEPGKKPLNLAQLVSEFTDSFLGSKDIKAWASKDYLGKMPDERKYALKLIGKRVKGNKIEMPEEQRGFDYIVSHLRYLKNVKSEDENKKKEAYEKLHSFFSGILGVAEREIGKLV